MICTFLAPPSIIIASILSEVFFHLNVIPYVYVIELFVKRFNVHVEYIDEETFKKKSTRFAPIKRVSRRLGPTLETCSSHRPRRFGSFFTVGHFSFAVFLIFSFPVALWGGPI